MMNLPELHVVWEETEHQESTRRFFEVVAVITRTLCHPGKEKRWMEVLEIERNEGQRARGKLVKKMQVCLDIGTSHVKNNDKNNVMAITTFY